MDARVKPGRDGDVKAAQVCCRGQRNDRTVNSISSPKFGDMGHSPTFSDSLVEAAQAS